MKHDETVVLYYGDYDPTGLRMVKNLKRDLEEKGIYFEHVAITKEQIREFHLEHLKEAMTDEVKAKLNRDRNTAAFKRENEGDVFQIELDALNALAPEDFIDMLENSVDRHFDESIYKEVLEDKKHSGREIGRQVRKYVKDFDILAKEFRKKQKQEK